MSNKKFRQGRFFPKNPNKYAGRCEEIIYRSSWELKMMRWCDNNPSVVQWASEEVVIPYYSRADQRQRRYFMDFIVKLVNVKGEHETILIEVKPEKETIPPVRGRKRQSTWLKESYTWSVNQDKWDAAKEFARNNGMKFIIMTEYDLGIKNRK